MKVASTNSENDRRTDGDCPIRFKNSEAGESTEEMEMVCPMNTMRSNVTQHRMLRPVWDRLKDNECGGSNGD